VTFYNPKEKKLEPKTISCILLDMQKSLKVIMFYCPSHNTRIVESRNVKFLINDLISGSDLNQNNHNEIQPSKSNDRLIVIHAPLVQERIRQLLIRVPQIVGDRSSC